ncbi:cilia- and flagella-associated protein 46 isoform X2 [Paramormyrops kingsleyae]|uniref:cilia- and flagella-associated protein 46 isoform X2 n=1 Tax=Paramormyrops kingsleyae TaxID=1676925 RepID=UPI003B97C6B9
MCVSKCTARKVNSVDIEIRQCLTKAETLRDTDALKAAYTLIKDVTKGKSAADARSLCPELYVVCAEQAIQLGCPEVGKDCLMMYFESGPAANQFLSRAYLCQGQLTSPVTFGSVVDVEKAMLYFLKAIEISKEQPRYHFLVFNASVLYFQMIQPLLRPGFRQHLVSSLAQVVKALEEIGEADHRWRAQLMLHLVECLVEAGKSKEAASFAKHTSDFIETNAPDLYPKIFSLQVRHKLLEMSKAFKKTETSLTLAIIYKIQKLKCEADCPGIRKDYPAKLKEVFLLLLPSTTVHSKGKTKDSELSLGGSILAITPEERSIFFLELAYLSLQLKYPDLAADCLRELEMGDVSDTKWLIKLECLRSELDVHRRRAKIEEYSKNDVEDHLRIVRRLDQCLQNAVGEGDSPVILAVCATLWNVCLPLLQHNLRKRIRGQLVRLAQTLEDIHSPLLELRCQIHSEVGEADAEEDRLESALEHLQKALRLDERGLHLERLSTVLHQLQIQSMMYKTPEKEEDQAALLIDQAKRARSKNAMKKNRSLLVKAGIALAPGTFPVVLDANAEVEDKDGQSQIDQLSAKAKHHTACVHEASGHLKKQGNENDRLRVRLWAALAKTARKQKVWDVCRAACRFCLLYDDGRWKSARKDSECLKDESPGFREEGQFSLSAERDLLRLLAEVHFINGEATIQKLHSEGVDFNQEPLPPKSTWREPTGDICQGLEENPQWAAYREWLRGLSAYATASFLQAAELGAALGEAWIVSNAAVYLWNHNSHVLASGVHRQLQATFRRLIDVMKLMGETKETALLVLLCNVAAKGLIESLSLRVSTTQEKRDDERGQEANRAKKGAGKGTAKSGSIPSILPDPSALQDIKIALELCDYALHLTNGNVPGETLLIAARKEVIATWVRIKQMLQRQTEQKLDVEDESNNETVISMTRVLVGIEMLLCNTNSTVMEFSLPSLSVLVKMASDCRWTDPVVELQVWTHLLHFAHLAQDHELIMSCSHNALQLEADAVKWVKTSACVLCSSSAIQDMLSNVACMRGLSAVEKSNGDPLKYRDALKTLQAAVSFAEQAGNYSMCVVAVKHYWNAGLRLMDTPLQRQELKAPMEEILRAMASTRTRTGGKREERKILATQTKLFHEQPSGFKRNSQTLEMADDDVALSVAMYSLLFRIHADRAEWKAGLLILDQAVQELPDTQHMRIIFEHRVLAKARLGQSVAMDMQRFCEEGEEHMSCMWHRAARCSGDAPQKLVCYQNAVMSLQSADSRWLKTEYLLEFGEWLYCSHFPLNDAVNQIQLAIDLLLNLKADAEASHGVNKGARPDSVRCQPQMAAEGPFSSPSLCDLRDVKQLAGLVRAHTLLSTMLGRASHQHLHHCLLACSFILRIWQLSLATASEVIGETAKNPVLPSKSSPSPTVKKDKGKKSKEPPLLLAAEDKPKQDVAAVCLPSTSEEWAQYDCPKEVRLAVRFDTSMHSVNRESISKQTQTLYFLDLLAKELHSAALTHLTLPVLHLAELISHDLMDNKSLSDLYRLRIAKSCSALGFTTSAAYQEMCVGSKFIYEEEQIACRKAVYQWKNYGRQTVSDADVSKITFSWGRSSGPSAHHVWIDKAELCLSVGLYQPARLLLGEANIIAKELDDRAAEAKSLLFLANLARLEQNSGQALALLEAAQKIGGDEDFWYSLTMSLAETLAEGEGHEKKLQACLTLERAISVLKSVLDKRLNRNPVLKFQIASMEARKALFQIQSHPEVSFHPDSVRTLMTSCDALRDTTNEFLMLGHREQGAETALRHAETLRILAKHTDDMELKQGQLLDSYFLMQKAIGVQLDVVLDVQHILIPEETQAMSLPVTRRLTCYRLALADLALEMLEQVCKEEMKQARLWERKGSIERTVEEFVRMTPDLTAVQQEWLNTSKSLGQVVLMQLEAVTSSCTDSVETKTRALCMQGRCLRLLAVQRDPLYLATQWNIELVEKNRMDMKQEHDEEEQMEDLQRNAVRPINMKQRQYSSKAAELQQRHNAAQKLLAQANETLAQVIGLSLQHKFTHILPDASLNMLECYGQFDSNLAGQYLALYQSCRCSSMMNDALRTACADVDASQLAALLNVQRNLLATKEEGPSNLLRSTEEILQELSKVYRDLSVSPAFFSILKELPSNCKILLLQHTDDRSVLYGAFFDKAMATSQRQKGDHLSGTLVCTKVAKANVVPEEFSRILQNASSFKQENMQNLLKDKNLHTVPKNSINMEKKSFNFNSIVQAMENYLHPIVSQFDSCFGTRHGTVHTPIVDSAKTKGKEEKSLSDKDPSGSPAESGECVILLADRQLMELPLEALRVLQKPGIRSVSRDFSLQLFHSRLQNHHTVESAGKRGVKGGKAVKGTGDQGKAVGAVPVNRVLPPDAIPVDTHDIKYVVDPYNEAGYLGSSGPVERMRQILEKHKHQYTSLWQGLTGSHHAPSLAEFEQCLINCSAFIFNGMENFLSYISPSKLVALNISECKMAILLDLAHSSVSRLRQSKIDSQKSVRQLTLESPVETAVLLSLSGVHCIMLNQWHTTIQRNVHNMDIILENLLKTGMTSGQTVHDLRRHEAQNFPTDGSMVPTDHRAAMSSELPETCKEGSSNSKAQNNVSVSPWAFNYVIYGLPNLVVT